MNIKSLQHRPTNEGACISFSTKNVESTYFAEVGCVRHWNIPFVNSSSVFDSFNIDYCKRVEAKLNQSAFRHRAPVEELGQRRNIKVLYPCYDAGIYLKSVTESSITKSWRKGFLQSSHRTGFVMNILVYMRIRTNNVLSVKQTTQVMVTQYAFEEGSTKFDVTPDGGASDGISLRLDIASAERNFFAQCSCFVFQQMTA